VPAPLVARQLPWSADNERDALRAIRVGLYPIDRAHPMADGKCGLKAVLYMAHGIPPIVTPTPTNALIVRDGIDGLHADTAEQWVAAIERLLDDDELWSRCSLSAHARAKACYSTEVWGPQVAGLVRELVDRNF
jgi:glycosyltransferase involved in cell wall biosynthesis